MDELKYIWKDGKLVNWHDATTHVLSHGLHYGTSVFEGIRLYNSNNKTYIFRLDEHLKRFFYSAEAIGLKCPYSIDELKKAIINLCLENNISEGYIRPIMYYGYGSMGLNPDGAKISTVIAVWPWDAYLGDKAVSVKTSKFIRIHPESLVYDAKVGGHYVNSIIARMDVEKKGYDEALFLDYNGDVAEGPVENIFYVKNGKVYTAETGNILPGLTRQSVFEICKKELNLELIEDKISLEDLYKADEAFFTGTAIEVQPISSVDDKKIGDGKSGEVTKKIQEIYSNIVHGENEDYNKWLTRVEK